MKIAPSMLACDYTKMGEELRRVSKDADYIHLDIMDGCFVPNISYGPDFIRALRPLTDTPFDVHLMIESPRKFIREIVKAGADLVTIHLEAEPYLEQTLRRIRELGAMAGLSIKPGTPVEELFPYLDQVDMVLIMTVEPGFGGQTFMEEMLDKVRVLQEEMKERRVSPLIEVDGGVNEENVVLASQAGADICVAGTAVFRSSNPAETIRRMQWC